MASPWYKLLRRIVCCCSWDVSTHQRVYHGTIRGTRYVWNQMQIVFYCPSCGLLGKDLSCIGNFSPLPSILNKIIFSCYLVIFLRNDFLKMSTPCNPLQFHQKMKRKKLENLLCSYVKGWKGKGRRNLNIWTSGYCFMQKNEDGKNIKNSILIF